EAAASAGVTPEVLTLDVCDEAAACAAVEEVIARAGRIDLLVNNAGIGGPGSVEETEVAVARQIFDTNYFGTVHMVRAALPHMRARRSGTIVNISSISAEYCLATLGHYAASKKAVEALSEALSEEVRPHGIGVVVVAPGVTATPMFTGRKYLRPVSPQSPYLDHLKRLLQYFSHRMRDGALTPDEVAQAIEEAASAAEGGYRRVLMGPDVSVLERDLSAPWRIQQGRRLLDEVASAFNAARRRV